MSTIFAIPSDPMFCPIDPSEINAIFADEEERDQPPTCSVCLEWDVADWRIVCGNGHSLCLTCATFLAHAQDHNQRRCPTCRQGLLMPGDGGTFMPDRAGNRETAAFKAANPDYDATAAVQVERPCCNKDAGCAGEFNRADMKTHLERHCEQRKIPCPYAKFGCLQVGPREEMAKHAQEYDHARFLLGYLEHQHTEAQKREDELAKTVSDLRGAVDGLVTVCRAQHETLTRLHEASVTDRDRVASMDNRVASLNTDVRAAIQRLPERRTGGSDRQRRANRLSERRRAQIADQQGQIEALRNEVQDLERNVGGGGGGGVGAGVGANVLVVRGIPAIPVAPAADGEMTSDEEEEELPLAQRRRLE